MISIILVNPKYTGNVGSVCRAMENFGFEKLVLVNPCELSEGAGIMAVHAKETLEGAETVESFDEVRKKYDLLVATTAVGTAKDDYFLRMTLKPSELKQKLEGVSGDIGIVFGPEDDGLSNELIEQCDFAVTIPTSEKYRAMNLSHSVAVVLYELSKIEPKQEVRLASAREKGILMTETMNIIEKTDFAPEKRKVFNTMLRKITGRALLTGREANTLIGALKSIKEKLK